MPICLSSSQIQHTKSMYEIHSNNIKQSLLSFPYSLQHFKTTEIFHFIHGHKGIIKLPRDNKEGEHPGIFYLRKTKPVNLLFPAEMILCREFFLCIKGYSRLWIYNFSWSSAFAFFLGGDNFAYTLGILIS